MRQRTGVGKRALIKSEVQRRVLHVEFRIARANFARLNAEHFPVEVDALLDTLYVERQMSFQRRNLHRGRIVLAFHSKPP